ncbi:MAG: sulfatase-like hydrolase/transferase, partial [Cyclobacteriaceae bacterium]|nr:sulfatase-like hydrolase/transferase [Cyclobacteriaceae bacterium]
GRILKTLKEQGIDEQTLVFFTSDNGGYLHYNKGVWPEVSSNGPFRGQKGQLYEGGHRVPAIARWPGKIKGGTVTSVTAMTFDILPTVLDLLNVTPPGIASPHALDGVSILPLLLENQPPPPRVLCWRTPGQKAVREGNWKLVTTRAGNAPELFDLDSDPAEASNLAARYPEKVQALLSKLNAWEESVDNGM